MAEVVKLKPNLRLDLRGDNRLPVLLEEREKLKIELRDIQSRLKELDAELKGKLGNAERLITDGWMVSQSSYIRKEYTIPEATIRRMSVRRTSDKRVYKDTD